MADEESVGREVSEQPPSVGRQGSERPSTTPSAKRQKGKRACQCQCQRQASEATLATAQSADGLMWGATPKPFRLMPLRRLLACHDLSWNEAYLEWGRLQLHVGLFNAVVSSCLGATALRDTAALNMEFAVDILTVYVLAHICFFVAHRGQGCAASCPLGMFTLAAAHWSWAVARMAYALSWCDDPWGIARACLGAVYSVTVLYMGLACLKIWMQQGRAQALARAAQENEAPV